jgi:DNA polymerase I
MLINADVKSLEVFVAADRYKDDTLRGELLNKLDLHSLNQERFKLPDRVTAKRFIFKLLYGATAYGYSVDSDFINVGYSEKQWQRVIDEFYTKYSGIAKGHTADIKFVQEHGYLEIPSGRYYNYAPKKTAFGWKWPLTTIKNYPIQGFGADLVKLARVEFYKRLQQSNLPGEFICTIHDSLVVDVPDEMCYTIKYMLRDSIEAVPALCKEWFDYEFSLPVWCEVQAGPNKRDMEEVIFN